MKDTDFPYAEIYNSVANSLQQFSIHIEQTIDNDAMESFINSMKDVIISCQQTRISLEKSIDWESLVDISDSFIQLKKDINLHYSSEYFEKLSTQISSSTNQLSDHLYDTWIQVAPMITEENHQLLHLTENPSIEKVKHKTPLSISDKIAVLGLLLTIFTLLLGFLPDTQLEKLQQQNEEIIANQQRSIELTEERNQQLEKSILMLQDTIEALHQEIQSFREQEQDVINCSDLQTNSQQQNALDQHGDS